VPEDGNRCVVSVMAEGRGALSYQCSRRRGRGPAGEFCVHHAQIVDAGRHVSVPPDDGTGAPPAPPAPTKEESREAKLPEWAQRELRLLRMRLREARADVERIQPAPDSSSMLVLDPRAERPVGFTAALTVTLRVREDAGRPGMQGWLTFKVEDGGVVCSAAGTALMVEPRSNNSVRLWEGRR
jgi:hypothetical protein